MEKYTQIKSEFIKKKLSETPWENRKYIEDLMFLERAILNNFENLGVIGSMSLANLRRKNEKEFLEICNELDPKGYKDIRKQEQKEKNKNEKQKNKEKKELEKIKENWIKAGGRI